jgi:5'-3' exonuclease
VPSTTTPSHSRLMLLDAASLYFRSFHGIPDSVRAPDGSPVNAVRGFLDTIAYLVTLRRPERLVACWDEDWRPAFRVRAIPSYKAHRVAPGPAGAAGAELVPDLLAPQIPVIIEALGLLGIARAGAAGYEADDVIGTLTAREIAAGGGEVDVVTGDRDLFQLADDRAAVRVLYVGKGVRNLEIVNEAWLRAKYGVNSAQGYADLAVLRGDPSDGLPGVAGIGEKTAAGLLSRFGDLAGVRAAAVDPGADLSPGQRRKLLEAAGYLDVAPAVVRVAPDAPVPPQHDHLPQTPPDHELLIAFAERWGLTSSVTRVVKAFTG